MRGGGRETAGTLAATSAAAKDGLYCRKDVAADAYPVINNQAVGNEAADVLRSAGGLGQGRPKRVGSLGDTCARGLQLPSCSPFPLLQGGKDIRGIENAAHGSASSSSSSLMNNPTMRRDNGWIIHRLRQA